MKNISNYNIASKSTQSSSPYVSVHHKGLLVTRWWCEQTQPVFLCPHVLAAKSVSFASNLAIPRPVYDEEKSPYS